MAPVTSNGRPRAADLHEQMGVELYRAAYRAGRNLSVHLEALDPSDGYNDGLDAFERQMRIAGIVTRSRPEIGVYADTLGAFDRSDQARMLVPELFARMWRGAMGASVSTRALYSASDEIPGGAALPLSYAAQPRVSRRAPPLRLAEIIALSTPIDSASYDAYYLTTDASESRMVRVAEGTEVPGAKLQGGDQSIKLKKYGRTLIATYESLRRLRIDKVRLWMEQLAIQTEMDKISAAIYTLVNGDGNSNSATNWQIKTDFDSTATGKTVTLKGYLNWKLKWSPAYQLTHVVGTEGDVLKLCLLNIGSGGTAVPFYLADATGPMMSGITLRDGVKAGITADVPTDKLVGLDASAALEMVTEIGSDIEEVERHARRQVQEITMTEVMGFAVFDKEAAKTLELEA